MDTKQPKRNMYRGLMQHVKAMYDWKNNTPAEIHAALQDEERWKGVGYPSVSATVSVLRASAGMPRKVAFHHRQFKGRKTSTEVINGEAAPRSQTKHRRLDVLITIPMPRKQTATLTYDEARGVYTLLRRVFNGG